MGRWAVRLVHAGAQLLCALAAVCLTVMMAITVTDVVLRAINPAWRLRGVVDVVELSLVWMIFTALPIIILTDAQVRVDLVDRLLPRLRRPLIAIGAIATFAYLAGVGSQIITPALDAREFRDVTMDLRISKFYHWMAIWIGVAAALVASLVVALSALFGARAVPVPDAAGPDDDGGGHER